MSYGKSDNTYGEAVIDATTKSDSQKATEAAQNTFSDGMDSLKTNASKLKDATGVQATKVKDKVQNLGQSENTFGEAVIDATTKSDSQKATESAEKTFYDGMESLQINASKLKDSTD